MTLGLLGDIPAKIKNRIRAPDLRIQWSDLFRIRRAAEFHL